MKICSGEVGEQMRENVNCAVNKDSGFDDASPIGLEKNVKMATQNLCAY